MENPNDLLTEIKGLKAQLTEAQETLQAIRSGEVDALVVAGSSGDQVFTLKGAEMPYRILVEEMNQGALLLLLNGTILYANTRFAALAKMPLEQVIGSGWQQFFVPANHAQLEACLKSAVPVRPGDEVRDELSLQASDGSVRPVHLSLRSMSASGVEGFSVIVTDLTERKRSENALRKTSEQLFEKNVALEAFSHSISHDMRAPLRSMRSYIQIILESYGAQLDPEAKSLLSRIEGSAKRLDRLIQDVLAYSTLSSEENEVATLDLDKMVHEMVDSYPNLGQAKIEIVPSVARVRGYEVALGQCISNLLGNAIKFVPAGRIPSVKIWTQRNNGRLRFWVQDNGIGILPKDQGKIFDVFTRLHRSEVYEGTGLGLSIVRKAVEKMGGQVGVESELGQGSRFWIELESA